MRTRIVHILAIFLTGIVTGSQYIISFDYNPDETKASFYIEKMQYGVDHVGAPLFGLVILAIAMCFVSAVTYFRSGRNTSLLLIGAGSLMFIMILVTIFGNIPQLDVMDTWNAKSPPPDWLDVGERWYMFHMVRVWLSVIGFFLAIISVFTIGNSSPRPHE